jgi:hypothetical protein
MQVVAVARGEVSRPEVIVAGFSVSFFGGELLGLQTPDLRARAGAMKAQTTPARSRIAKSNPAIALPANKSCLRCRTRENFHAARISLPANPKRTAIMMLAPYSGGQSVRSLNAGTKSTAGTADREPSHRQVGPSLNIRHTSSLDATCRRISEPTLARLHFAHIAAGHRYGELDRHYPPFLYIINGSAKRTLLHCHC